MTTSLRQLPEVRLGVGQGHLLVTVALITALGVAPDPALLARLFLLLVAAAAAHWSQ